MNEAAGSADAARPADAGGTREEERTQSGDPVCWMHLLCSDCGALPTATSPDRCWQCGTPR